MGFLRDAGNLFIEYTREQLDTNIAVMERHNPHFPEIWDWYASADCTCTSCVVLELPGEWDEWPEWNDYATARWLRGDTA